VRLCEGESEMDIHWQLPYHPKRRRASGQESKSREGMGTVIDMAFSVGVFVPSMKRVTHKNRKVEVSCHAEDKG
jgi:hypothetical protein